MVKVEIMVEMVMEMEMEMEMEMMEAMVEIMKKIIIDIVVIAYTGTNLDAIITIIHMEKDIEKEIIIDI